jgi:SHS family lactate transporter-like MFS transporter
MAQEQPESWTPAARRTVIASYLGWSLDAFDFFLLVFVLKDIASTFGTDVKALSLAITLTLAMRPIGAFIFGRLADHYGRKPVLMADIIAYSVIGFASAFAPNLTVLLILRALFGVAMGGEWGIGASLTMETVPARARGFVSGLLQSGYPTGYFIASAAYGLLFPVLGWRGLFMVSLLPALLVLFIRAGVPESPGWTRQPASESGTLAVIKTHWKRALYAVLLMTCFNFFSHGTQDLYPTFLRVQHKFDPHTVSIIALIYNAGAIIGGILSGMLSERFGRRRVIVIAALAALPVIPLWAFSHSVVLLAAGAFLMQLCVQGAWGVIPAHLNELSPNAARGTFPGFVYQLGNFLASANAIIQAGLAADFGGTGEPIYAPALAIVAGTVSIVIALVTAFGPEEKGKRLTQGPVASE